MHQFTRELHAINGAITSFNLHLAPPFHIPQFDPIQSIDSKAIVKIIHKDWNGFPFPNNNTRGVYFLFGQEKATGENGLYIGKASLSSRTSRRLYDHLNPYREKDFYEMKGCRGGNYILNFMASIDLDKLEIPFIAPALEEYLITALRKDFKLMNGTGN